MFGRIYRYGFNYKSFDYRDNFYVLNTWIYIFVFPLDLVACLGFHFVSTFCSIKELKFCLCKLLLLVLPRLSYQWLASKIILFPQEKDSWCCIRYHIWSWQIWAGNQGLPWNLTLKDSLAYFFMWKVGH